MSDISKQSVCQMTKAYQSLAIAVVVPEGGDPNRPRIQIRVDDQDLFPDGGYVGCDPERIISDPSPMLPDGDARRLALYQCNCEILGCGAIAPLIRADEDAVYWSDARDFVGVFVEPDDSPDAEGGRKVRLPNFVFKRSEYEREVRRAVNDRSWETESRVTTRLMKNELAQLQPFFNSKGCRSTWVWTEDDETSISFFRQSTGGFLETRPDSSKGTDVLIAWVKSQEQVIFRMNVSGSPEQRVQEIVRYLKDTDPTDWPIDR